MSSGAPVRNLGGRGLARSPSGARTRLYGGWHYQIGDDIELYYDLEDFTGWQPPDYTSEETWRADLEASHNVYTYYELANPIDVYDDEDNKIGEVTHRITEVDLNAGIGVEMHLPASPSKPSPIPVIADAILQQISKQVVINQDGPVSTSYFMQSLNPGLSSLTWPQTTDAQNIFQGYMAGFSEDYGGTVDCSLWYWYAPTTGSGYGVYKDGKFFRKIMGRYNVPEDAGTWSVGKMGDNDVHYDISATEYIDYAIRAADGFSSATYNQLIVQIVDPDTYFLFSNHLYESDLSQENLTVPAFTITTAPV